jgi:hypothetical protein
MVKILERVGNKGRYAAVFHGRTHKRDVYEGSQQNSYTSRNLRVTLLLQSWQLIEFIRKCIFGPYEIEIVFSLLQRKTLNGASFKTKDQLREAIEAFIRRHNERTKPFRWRKREVKGSQLKNTIVNLRN